MAMKINDIEKGLTFDVNNAELIVYYGFPYKGLDAIVRFEYISDDKKCVLYELNDIINNDYSYSLDKNNEIVFNCSVNLVLPKTLFDKDFDYFTIGYYFYGEDNNYTTSGLGICSSLQYELNGDIVKIARRT